MAKDTFPHTPFKAPYDACLLAMTKQGAFAMTSVLGCQYTDHRGPSVTARGQSCTHPLAYRGLSCRNWNVSPETKRRKLCCALPQLHVLTNILLYHPVGKPCCCRAMIPQLPLVCLAKYALFILGQTHKFGSLAKLGKTVAQALAQPGCQKTCNESTMSRSHQHFSDHMSTKLPAQNECIT